MHAPYGQTYRYGLAKCNRTDAPIAYNQYARLLPKRALEVLYSEATWSLHLGGDDLLNTFSVLGKSGFFTPSISKPHTILTKILKDNPTFFLQPLPFDSPLNIYPESATLHEWSFFLNRAMDDLRVKHGVFARGWFVVPCMDPHILAENVLATFGGPVVRNLRGKIAGAKVFKRVGMAHPVAKDKRVTLVEGEAQSTPLIALYLHAGGGLGAPPIPPTNHDLSTRHTTQRAIGMAKDKSILMQTQTETDRNATTRLRLFVRPEEMGGGRIIARHAYRYINEQFAPGMGDKVSYNSVNCFYPFMDASVYQGSPGTSTTPPAFGGYVKIDYALPTPIAKVLMQSITSHEFFTKGTVFAIPLTAIADENSYFVIPTRDAIRGFVGDYNPAEIIATVLGQLPGGRGTITLLGTSVKSANLSSSTRTSRG